MLHVPNQHGRHEKRIRMHFCPRFKTCLLLLIFFAAAAAAAAYYSPPFHTVRIWVEKNSVILGRLREYFKKPSFLYCLHIFS